MRHPVRRLAERGRAADAAHFDALAPDDAPLHFGAPLPPQAVAACGPRVDGDGGAVFALLATPMRARLDGRPLPEFTFRDHGSLVSLAYGRRSAR
ncbi:hypothetical protein BURK1_01109 [Burkholderiales bacterium]|nr:hypothetical protein BURK1_01109 [Burkholderiales bacterium]